MTDTSKECALTVSNEVLLLLALLRVELIGFNA